MQKKYKVMIKFAGRDIRIYVCHMYIYFTDAVSFDCHVNPAARNWNSYSHLIQEETEHKVA